jgi:pimeloyl-ACP methyl ester carboxylesterase
MKYTRVVWMFFLLTLSACVNKSAKMLSPTNLDTSLDVGGHALHIKCAGSGTPLVLIDAGLGEPAIESGSWSKVVEEITKTNTACLYDRAGLGGSQKSSSSPRTVQDFATDLKNLTSQVQTNGKWVLVAHSMAGLTARVYAHRHPEDLRALVLVDATHPEQWSRWLSVLPEQKQGEPGSFSETRQFLQKTYSDPNANPETLDIAKSAKALSPPSSLGSLPLVVVTHSPKWKMVPNLPEDLQAKIEAQSQRMQVELGRLSSSSTHLISEHAGHYIHAEDPALVVQAIRQVAK